MTIKTEVEEVEKHTVILKVEVPFEDLGESINRAYRDVAGKVRIPGFRKGKAPRAIIDQMIGKDAVLNEALQDFIPDIYPKAVESSGIDPVTMPQIDVVQIKENEPLIFTAKVQVKPEIKLGSFDDLIIDPLKQKTIKDEVEEEIDKLRNKFATLDVVKKRAAQKGDFVLIDYDGYIDGKPFEGGRGADYMLELGSGSFIDTFEDQLVGAKTGGEVEVNVTFPKDYQGEHVAGAAAVFKVTVKEIKEKKLPKADDEFAQNVSKFDTLKELKGDLKKVVGERQDEAQKAAMRTGAVEKIAEISEVDLPSGLVDRRVEHMLRDFGNRLNQMQGMSLDAWLASIGDKAADTFKESYKGEAEKSLRNELVLEEVTKVHSIEATDEDVENEIKRLAEGSKRDIDELKEEIKARDGISYLKERLSINKTVDFLVSKAKLKKRDDADESGSDSN